MTTIPRAAAAIHALLTTVADQAARETGFVQRRSKLSGSTFLQTLVFAWLADPAATLEQLALTAMTRGITVSRQAIAQRFSMEAADCIKKVLEHAVSMLVTAAPVPVPLLARFTAVWVQDSTTISLPAALEARWAGCGGSTAEAGRAAIKLQVRLDLLHGTLEGPSCEAGRSQDRGSALQHAPIEPGALRIADLGYFSLEVFRALGAAGGYWLSRYLVPVVVSTTGGQRLELVSWLRGADTLVLDQAVTLGVEQQLPCRLLAARVPPKVAAERRRKLRAEAQREGKTVSSTKLVLADWTLLITNVPPALLTAEEALVLARARWQIELLFKLWKGHGLVDSWRSANPARILCEVYAKLLALVIEHWVMLVTCWQYPDRSLPNAARTIQAFAQLLATTFDRRAQFVLALKLIARALTDRARIGRRRAKPASFQLLLDPQARSIPTSHAPVAA